MAPFVYYGYLFVGILLYPPLLVIAAAAGLLSRQWWQALLGGLVAAVTFASLFSARRSLEPFVIAAAAGVLVSLFLFFLRREFRDDAN